MTEKPDAKHITSGFILISAEPSCSPENARTIFKLAEAALRKGHPVRLVASEGSALSLRQHLAGMLETLQRDGLMMDVSPSTPALKDLGAEELVTIRTVAIELYFGPADGPQ